MNDNDGFDGPKRPTEHPESTWSTGWGSGEPTDRTDAPNADHQSPAESPAVDPNAEAHGADVPAVDRSGEHHFSGVFASGPAVDFGSADAASLTEDAADDVDAQVDTGTAPSGSTEANDTEHPEPVADEPQHGDVNAPAAPAYGQEPIAAAEDDAAFRDLGFGASEPPAESNPSTDDPDSSPANEADEAATTPFVPVLPASTDDAAPSMSDGRLDEPGEPQQSHPFGGSAPFGEPTPFGTPAAASFGGPSASEAPTTQLPSEQVPVWGESPTIGAPPVALPGDRNLPFGSTSSISAPGTPDAGGPVGPGSGPGEPQAPADGAAPKKKRRRGLIILAAVAAVLLVAAAVLIPILIHQNNVNRGNDLAAAYDQQVADYEAALSGENIAPLTTFTERPAKEQLSAAAASGGQYFYDLSPQAMDAVKAACADIVAPEGGEATLTSSLNAITAVKVPELPADKDAEASDAYVAAQQKASDLSAEQETRTAAVTEMDGIVTDLAEYCTNIGAYTALNDKLNSDISGVLAESFVVPKGGKIESSDKSVVWPCDSEGGCTDLYNADNRKKYIDAYTETYVKHFTSLADLYSKQCFMAAFADVCSVAATEYQKVAAAHQAFVDYLTNNEPTVKVGELMYPDLQSKWDAATAAQTAAEQAIVDKWKEVDPAASFAGAGNSPLKPSAAALATYIQSKETRFAELLSEIQPKQ